MEKENERLPVKPLDRGHFRDLRLSFEAAADNSFIRYFDVLLPPLWSHFASDVLLAPCPDGFRVLVDEGLHLRNEETAAHLVDGSPVNGWQPLDFVLPKGLTPHVYYSLLAAFFFNPGLKTYIRSVIGPWLAAAAENDRESEILRIEGMEATFDRSRQRLEVDFRSNHSQGICSFWLHAGSNGDPRLLALRPFGLRNHFEFELEETRVAAGKDDAGAMVLELDGPDFLEPYAAIIREE